MNEKQPLTEEQIEQLVRQHLLREAESVDAAGILAGVRARIAAPLPSASVRPAGLNPAARWAGRTALAVAASVLLAILWALPVSTPQASAETLVREVQQAHARPIELCYLRTESNPNVGEGESLLPLPPEGKLWVRGSQFFIENLLPSGRVSAWGRDAQGRVWFAPLPRAGFRFEAREVRGPLARMCDVHSMNAEKLLSDVLANFDLHKKEAAPGLQVIEAQLRADYPLPPLRFVRLEIDTRKKLLHKIELHRRHPNGLSLTTFTLVENAPLRADAKYTLEGHLAKDAHVYSMEDPPPERFRMLRNHYEMGRRPGPPEFKPFRGMTP